MVSRRSSVVWSEPESAAEDQASWLFSFIHVCKLFSIWCSLDPGGIHVCLTKDTTHGSYGPPSFSSSLPSFESICVGCSSLHHPSSAAHFLLTPKNTKPETQASHMYMNPFFCTNRS